MICSRQKKLLLAAIALCAVALATGSVQRGKIEQATSAVSERLAIELKKWPVVRHLVDFPIPTDREN